MNQTRLQYQYLRRFQAEKGVLGKLAWGGIFLSLLAFAYYLSGLFIVFGGSVFFLLASYHLKYHIDVDPPQPNHRNRSEIFEYIDGSVSHDPLPPSRFEFDERQTVYPSYSTDSLSRSRSSSLVKAIRRHLDQEPEHSPQPIRTLAKVALKSFDEVYHAQHRYRKTELQVCTHRARKWEDVEELRECPNCRQRFDEVLRCGDCGFMSCPDCRYFMPPAGWEASFGRLKKEGFGGGVMGDGW